MRKLLDFYWWWLLFTIVMCRASLFVLAFAALSGLGFSWAAECSLYSVPFAVALVGLRLVVFYRGVKDPPRWFYWGVVVSNLVGLGLLIFSHIYGALPYFYFWCWSLAFGLGFVAGLGALYEKKRWANGLW